VGIKNKIIFILLFSYGVAVGHYRIFPYNLVRGLKKTFIPRQGKVNRDLAKRTMLTQHQLIKGKAHVVMLGDSLTQAGLWSEHLNSKNIFNRGVNGDGLVDIYNRLGTVLQLKPQKVFILAGINDLLSGDSVDEVMTNYIKVVSTLTDANIKVVIQSTISCNLELFTWCANVFEKINQLNQRLQTYAKSRSITYINLNTYLSDQRGQLRAELTYDGVHLLGGAYQQWSSVILKEIN